MGVDWFTVIAQIINFLILVALLKRFLYRPIVRAMDRREEGIASRLAAAAETAANAEQQKEQYEGLLRELAANREDQIARTRSEVADLRQELLDKIRDEADRTRAQWQESFHRERETFLQALRHYVCKEVFVVVRKVASEMSDSHLQERMAICLERRMLGLEDAEREKLMEHFFSSRHEIIVKSALEMNPEARRSVLRTLTMLGVDPERSEEVRFDLDPSLVCGIEIHSGGRSLAWNMDDYLDEMEQRLLEAIGRSPLGSNTE